MNAYLIIEQLYNLWGWIAGLGAILAILPLLLSGVFNKGVARNESGRSISHTFFLIVLTMIGILLMFGSLIVYNAFVRVPPLYGKTVRAAWQELEYT